jgi:hypothetical protein
MMQLGFSLMSISGRYTDLLRAGEIVGRAVMKF